jgi:stage V sporulation protein D (sporulation-specific penicillin-binding protein)
MRQSFLPRIRIISVFLSLFVLLILSRLYFVQIVRGGDYSEQADRQYLRPIGNLYERGTIYFEDKNGVLISAATLKTGYTLSINNKLLGDPTEVHQQIEKIVDIEDDEDFFFKAGKIDDPHEEILKRMDEQKALAIRDLDINGVSIIKDKWRFYPGFDIGAQMLGFVGFNGQEYGGQYGLERYYEDILERESHNENINFFAEVFSNLSQSFKKDGLRTKGDIVTTIEPSVQTFFQTRLNGVQEEWNSELTAGVILNPKTGEIFAMAVTPSFDLNEFRKVEDIDIFRNPIVENVYEMGSIIKPLTMAAAIDAGAVRAESTYNDRGSLEIDGYTISNYDGESRGVVDMQEVLSQSLNTGVAFAVREMGNRVFADYMKNFGLTEKTGIDLPNEVSPLIKNLSSPRNIEYATASFGQGIAFSPIITARAMSALANSGVLTNPHLIKRIDYEIGPAKIIKTEEGRRVLKEETAEEITRMLVRVVDEALAGGGVALKNYSVAAKTGTAQIANPYKKGYYDDRFLHSFFGYFPAYDPQFLIFLYTVYPKEVRYASQTLTEPFMDITKFLINYYEIPPDR